MKNDFKIVSKSTFGYTWDGVGLRLTLPEGDYYAQGEDGCTLHDELEAATDEEVERILEQYRHLCE